MTKYHFNISINKKYNHAGTKAVVDCKQILLKHGYKDIEIDFVKAPYLLPFNLARLFYKLSKYYLQFKPGTLIVIQYPLLGINKYFNKYIKLLQKKGCKVACIVHDLDSLRAKDDNLDVLPEITSLAAYDTIIAHNSSMSALLRRSGYTGNLIEGVIFDYLVETPVTEKADVDNPQVIFAGNLARCEFLKDIDKINGVTINLYGPGFNNNMLKNNPAIKWLGSFPPERIIHEISGKFGLVWDGTSIYESTGLMGNYLKYNSPHKVSLYLACGLPVIVPESAAVAGFITENNLGITVKNLTELADVLKNITDVQYQAMRKSAREVGSLLKKGNYLLSALEKLEKLYNQNEVFN